MKIRRAKGLKHRSRRGEIGLIGRVEAVLQPIDRRLIIAHLRQRADHQLHRVAHVRLVGAAAQRQGIGQLLETETDLPPGRQPSQFIGGERADSRPGQCARCPEQAGIVDRAIIEPMPDFDLQPDRALFETGLLEIELDAIGVMHALNTQRRDRGLRDDLAGRRRQLEFVERDLAQRSTARRRSLARFGQCRRRRRVATVDRRR